MTRIHLHPEHFEERVDLAGTDAQLVRFADGDGSGAWGFLHLCRTWPDEQQADGVTTTCVAPRLTNHTMTLEPSGRWTVRASILCPDCGVHGWVTDGAWRTA